MEFHKLEEAIRTRITGIIGCKIDYPILLPIDEYHPHSFYGTVTITSR